MNGEDTVVVGKVVFDSTLYVHANLRCYNKMAAKRERVRVSAFKTFQVILERTIAA